MWKVISHFLILNMRDPTLPRVCFFSIFPVRIP
jgi:hypothetical protein